MAAKNRGICRVAKIKWFDIFETGIKFIDDDHRRLIDILQDIEVAHKEADIRGCRSAVGAFLDEAKAHFKREENYLQVNGYSDIGVHVKEHRKLVLLVVALLAKLQPDPQTGKEPALDEELIEDTFYLLLEDVIKADAEFKSLVA